MEYFIPNDEVSFEEEIKKSRFITYLQHTAGLEQAKAFWQAVRAQHPTARHHCWATVAGLPQDSQLYGFSDDGEPSGTAGKPMLNYLIGSGLGEVSAVVVRYSGGILLGTGGLVRAYGNGVHQALGLVERKRKVLRQTYRLNCGYDQFSAVQYLCHEYDVVMLDQQFLADIQLLLGIQISDLEHFQSALIQRFAGQLMLLPNDENKKK